MYTLIDGWKKQTNSHNTLFNCRKNKEKKISTTTKKQVKGDLILTLNIELKIFVSFETIP